MKIFFYTILSVLCYKGMMYVFFPKLIQDFSLRHIIDAPLSRLRQFGVFFWILAFAAWQLCADFF